VVVKKRPGIQTFFSTTVQPFMPQFIDMESGINVDLMGKLSRKYLPTPHQKLIGYPNN
jgi:hypothetical protein